jgi:hypothetical protein
MRRLFPGGRRQDSACGSRELAVASGHDRRQPVREISKTIQAFETHPTLSLKATFDANRTLN